MKQKKEKQPKKKAADAMNEFMKSLQGPEAKPSKPLAPSPQKVEKA